MTYTRLTSALGKTRSTAAATTAEKAVRNPDTSRLRPVGECGDQSAETTLPDA